MGKLQTRVDGPEPPMPSKLDAARPRSAGRTVQGRHGGGNQSYICFAELPGDTPRGLYAVADGALSANDGAVASEAVVETLKAAALRRHGGNGNGKPAPTLEEWVAEAHRALRESRNGMADGEHLVASLVCALLDGDELHTAHAGNGAIYLIHSGRIQRLTENYHIDDLGDPALQEEFGGKSLLGFSEDKCRAGMLKVRVTPGDTVLLCSGGLTESVDNVSLLEAATSADTPGEIVTAVMDKAVERGCSHDLSVVALNIPAAEGAAKPAARETAPPQQGKLIAAKYFAITLLITVLSMILYFGSEYLGEQQGERIADAGGAKTKPAAAPVKAASGNFITVNVDSAPRGAFILINGARQPGKTPAAVDAPAKGSFLLTVAMKGYKSETRMLEAPKNGNGLIVSIDLLPDLDPPGDLKISCVPACSYIVIDGERVNSLKYPFTGEYVISLPPGAHTVEAGGEGNKHQKTNADVESDGQTRTKFDFTGNLAPQTRPAPSEMPPMPAARPVPVPRQPQQRARVTVTTNEEETPRENTRPARSQTSAPKVIVESTYPDEDAAAAPHPSKTETKDSSLKTAAFIIVHATSADGKLQGCRIKFIQAGRMVANGYTGEAVKLSPGNYEIAVSKDGYKTYTSRKYFGAGAETVQVFMTK